MLTMRARWPVYSIFPVRSLAEAFNLADAWITMQNTASLMKAVDYVERELVKKGRLEGVNTEGPSAR